MKKLLLFLLPLAAFGQVTIPTIALTDYGNNYCRFAGTVLVGGVTGAPYMRGVFGTTMGGPYPYKTYSYQTANGAGAPGNDWALDISALNASTTYYAVFYGRPDENDATGEVSTAEQTCTTTNASTTPTLPTEYHPAYPNTTGSGYTIVPMSLNGSNQFAVTTNTTHTGGVFCASDPSWTMTAGWTIDQVLSELATVGGWGAVVEFPQGVTGQVPATAGLDNGGYLLPTIAIDPCATGGLISAANHRWNMFRTHQNATADFPPYDFRTGPNWTKVATLQAQQPVTVLSFPGQIFMAVLYSSSSVGIHHFWFSNLAFGVNTANSNGPWGPPIALGHGEGNADDAQTPPSYIVIERTIQNAPGPPASSVYVAQGVVGSAGADVFIGSNYIVNLQKSGDLAQGISIADCSTGPLTEFNNEVTAAGQGIYHESIKEQSCGRSNTMMQNVVSRMNAIYNPPSWLQPYNSGSTYAAWDGVARGALREPWESKNGQIVQVDGNTINGCFGGQTAGDCILVFNVANWNPTSGISGQHDISITNNYMSNAVIPFYGFGASSPTDNTGVGPDPIPAYNVLFNNNLGVNLGSTNYAAVGRSGLFNGYLALNSGFQNFQITNNSFSCTDADPGVGGFAFIPAMLQGWDGGQFSNGFVFTQNVMCFSEGQTGANESGFYVYGTTTNGGCGGGCPSFPVAPGPTTTNYSTLFNTTMIGLGSSVAATGTWSQNLIGCGNKYGSEPWADLTSSDCTSITANMPNLSTTSSCTTTCDSYPNPTCTIVGSGCMAQRITAMGLANYSAGDMTLTPNSANFMGAVGANITQVENHLGIVRSITATPSSTSAVVGWTAPDNNNCSLDWSTDGSTWGNNRLTATQGVQAQSVSITGLSASTLYYYRVLCYYDQSRPWFSFPAEATNMVTAATFTTLPVGVTNNVIINGNVSIGGNVVVN